MDYKGVLLEFLLKIPILFICGDLEGQDKSVGRCMICSSGIGTINGHICWYCDVPYDKTDGPFYRGRLTKSSDIAKLLVQQRPQEISGMGYLNIDENASHKLQYCNRTHRLNGSVPVTCCPHFNLVFISMYWKDYLEKRKLVLLPRRKGREWQNSVKRKNRNLRGALNQIPQQLPPKEKT
jgi:hypothetical protein